MNTEDSQHLKSILRHINNVHDNCMLIADNLINNKEDRLALKLIENGRVHDISKLSGIEWLYLRDTIKESQPELFKIAHIEHITKNSHHPESWIEGIHSMDRLHLAEFACDITARASEFGIGVHEWLKTNAAKKFSMKPQDKAYREVLDFLKMLLEKPFK